MDFARNVLTVQSDGNHETGTARNGNESDAVTMETFTPGVTAGFTDASGDTSPVG